MCREYSKCSFLRKIQYFLPFQLLVDTYNGDSRENEFLTRFQYHGQINSKYSSYYIIFISTLFGNTNIHQAVLCHCNSDRIVCSASVKCACAQRQQIIHMPIYQCVRKGWVITYYKCSIQLHHFGIKLALHMNKFYIEFFELKICFTLTALNE